MKKNIYIDQGATFSETLVVRDGNNAPIDLTGFTANSAIKKHYESANTYITLHTSVNTETSEVTISLPANLTGILKYGKYHYDILLNNGDTYLRAYEGIVTVTPRITP